MIQYGHKLEDVKKYSLSQVGCFLKAIYKKKGEESVLNMQFIRAAVWAEEKEFKKITSSVDKKPDKVHIPAGWIT